MRIHDHADTTVCKCNDNVKSVRVVTNICIQLFNHEKPNELFRLANARQTSNRSFQQNQGVWMEMISVPIIPETDPLFPASIQSGAKLAYKMTLIKMWVPVGCHLFTEVAFRQRLDV